MDPRGRSQLVALLLGGSLFATGLVVGRALDPAAPTPETSTAPSIDLAPLASRIDALERDLRAAIAAAASARTPASDPRPSDEAVLRDVADLRDVVARILAAPPERTREPVAAARERRLTRGVDETLAYFREIEARDDDEELQRAADELVRTHALWTIDEVIGRYGPPDWVDTDDGLLEIGYVRPWKDTDGSTIEADLEFTFASGRVCRVDCDT